MMKKSSFDAAVRWTRARGSDPVDGHVGQLRFKVFIHQLFVSVFREVSAAGPAAEKNLCSGPSDVKLSAAGRAFFLDTHGLLFLFKPV